MRILRRILVTKGTASIGGAIVYGKQLVVMTSRARMSATGWPLSITYLSVIVGGVYGAAMALYRILKGGQPK